MFIEQTKQIEGYTAASSLEKGKMTPADKVQQGTSILDYGKMQETYRMTEGGSFYMPNAVYQKPEAKEEETIVDQLDSQMDMSATNRKNQIDKRYKCLLKNILHFFTCKTLYINLCCP